jgi:Na+/alanine symporter
MIYCSNCGKPIPDENKFCTNCGAARPVAGSQTADQKEPVKPAAAETQKPIVITTTTVTETPQPAARPTTGVKNAFYNNVGFWGAVFLLIGFFLPFYKTIMSTISLSNMATGADSNAGRILLLLLPISAIILIIQGLTYAFHPLIQNIAKILPLLLMIFCLGALMREDETGRSLGSFFEIAQIGAYLTLLGSLLILFFKRKT